MSKRLCLVGTGSSGADVFDCALSDAVQHVPDRSDERSEILDAVGTCEDHDDAEGECSDLMIAFKLAVHRDERINLPSGSAE